MVFRFGGTEAATAGSLKPQWFVVLAAGRFTGDHGDFVQPRFVVLVLVQFAAFDQRPKRIQHVVRRTRCLFRPSHQHFDFRRHHRVGKATTPLLRQRGCGVILRARDAAGTVPACVKIVCGRCKEEEKKTRRNKNNGQSLSPQHRTTQDHPTTPRTRPNRRRFCFSLWRSRLLS